MAHVAAEEPTAAEAAAPRIVGVWKTIDDETGAAKSLVALSVTDSGELRGRVLEVFGQPDDLRCDKCEGARKDQLVRGMTILRGMQKEDEEWTGGEILDPKNGKTYRCTMAVQGDGKTLKVRGYIGFSLLGRTQYWKRHR
ncbi:MAG: DUF2147 domain-containing protein [Myxococcales bacterium FL481]|nr:MAG: DUF2147 domain-containing protein [Myxococcales bacterium FL481]